MVASPRRLRFVAGLLFAWTSSVAQAQHLHVQVQFNTASGWSLFWQDFDSGPFPADAHTQPLGTAARRRMVADPALTDVLVGADHAVWTLPQFDEPNLPSLGVGSQGTPGALVGGSLRLRLASFVGPGHFALHTSGTFGDTTVIMATQDGLDASDALAVSFPGGHIHANWSFTRPGLYELGFVAEATLASTGQPTNSAVTVFRFRVVEPAPPRLTIHREAERVVVTAEAEPNLPLRLDSAVEPDAWSLGSLHWSANGLLSWTNSASAPARFFRVAIPLP
jgi:surface-anchored protein